MGSGRLRAIQPKQSFHDANLNDTDDSPTVVTVQFDVSALGGRDNGARTVDATEPCGTLGIKAVSSSLNSRSMNQHVTHGGATFGATRTRAGPAYAL